MKNIQKVSLPRRTVRGVIGVSTKLAVAIAIMVGLMAGPITARADDHVSQLSYLQWLVKIAGDSAQFNNSSTAQDYVAWAQAKGMSPNGGWKPDKVLNREEFAQTLAQFLGLATKKGGDYVKILAREGINLLPDDSFEVSRKGLIFVFGDDIFLFRVPGLNHSEHKPPHPPKPPKPPHPPHP